LVDLRRPMSRTVTLAGMIGTKVLLRVRVGARDASVGGLVDGARILALFSDLAAELLIRLDGDEGLFHAYDSIEFLASVYAGDFLEATAELVDVAETERRIRFSASRVISHVRRPGLAASAADLLREPVVVCRATGRCVTPAELQRRPRELYVPQLPPGEPPTPEAVVTPPGDSSNRDSVNVVITATLAVADASARALREAIEAAVLCREGGAAVVHLRAPTEASLGEAAREIAAGTGGLVQVGSIGAPAAATSAVALVSVPCGSCNHGDDVAVATRPMIRDLARAAARASAVLLECREVGHLEAALALAEEGALAQPLRFELVLGAPGSARATDANLRFMSGLVPARAPWTLAATGSGAAADTIRLVESALRLGGHVRVGEGSATGAVPDLVRRAAGYARAIGRTPADPSRAREVLSLPPLSQRGEVSRS
jgi:3-keto-5-aminohexanoate cleavage enzyme